MDYDYTSELDDDACGCDDCRGFYAGNDARDAGAPAFNQGVDTVLGEAIAISNQRGGEYADSWAVPNLRTSVLDCVLRELPDSVGTWDAEQKRLAVIASISDVKISRFLGAWKEDTAVDLINYLAALTYWMRQYKEKK